MALPGVSKPSLSFVWSGIKNTAGRAKETSAQLGAAVQITRKDVLDHANHLADALSALDAYINTPGIIGYARNEENDGSFNLTIEYAAMRGALISAQDWIIGNFPTDGLGGLVVYTFDSQKRFVNINLTGTQLSEFRARLTALVDQIT